MSGVMNICWFEGWALISLNPRRVILPLASPAPLVQTVEGKAFYLVATCDTNVTTNLSAVNRKKPAVAAWVRDSKWAVNLTA